MHYLQIESFPEPWRDVLLALSKSHLKLLMLVLTLLVGTGAQATLDNDRLSVPGSHLGGSPDSPIFVGLFGQVGGTSEYGTGEFGGGATFVFRPGAADRFLPFLYRWNTSFVLQGDYQNIGPEQTLLSADVIFRRYIDDMRAPDAPGSFFWGLGMGASRAELPLGAGTSRIKNWSGLLEVGREWTIQKRYLVWVRGQYRYFEKSGFDYSGWTIQAGAGIPWPF